MRLIDADELHKALFAKQKWVVHYGDKHNEGYTSDQVHFAIDDAPTVEVVAKNETTTEVVRCRDCVYCKRFNDVWRLPKRDELLCTRCIETYHTTENDYCSRGERK